MQLLALDRATRFYASVMRLWLQYRTVLPLPVCEVEYEELVRDMAGTIQPVLQFLGLQWHQQMQNYTQTANERVRINTPSYNQVTEELYQHASGRWQRYRHQLAPVLPTLLPLAEQLGYRERAPGLSDQDPNNSERYGKTSKLP